ncbi:unnamed protein product [Lactuca virosa]|uniref:Uncharacterized protein n=1 Tax=Lactuca virosa TaxID=75947 RepID=A0AAU9M866_9ASTR|nr:unnamed protein product [Lactuca virosa]
MLISIISVSGSVMSLYKFPEHIGKMMRLIKWTPMARPSYIYVVFNSFHVQGLKGIHVSMNIWKVNWLLQ